MQLPGAPSLIFLAYLLLFLPWAGVQDARLVREADGGDSSKSIPSRERIWSQTLRKQAILLFLAWWTGQSFDDHLFTTPDLGLREGLLALLALAACFGLRSLLRSLRSEEERRGAFVYRLAPRTVRETALWVGAVLLASVAEEAAFRGVGVSILWYSLDSYWWAATLSAIAFSVAHWVQGWKSAVVIFGMALVFQGLVTLTGTLVLAMIVHAAYDFVAGWRIIQDAKKESLPAY